MLSLVRGKVHQLQSVASLVTRRIIKTSSTFDLYEFERKRQLFSIVQYSSRSNDGLENNNNKIRPYAAVSSHSRLRDMVLMNGGELFPDISLTQKDVDSMITSELPILNKNELVQFLLKSVKFSRKRNRRIEVVPRHLVLIKSCLSQFPTTSWTGKDVAFIMNSLQAVRNDNVGVNDLLVLMTTIMNESLKDTGTKSLTSQGIAMIMYGLRQMGSDSVEVRAMLSALLPKVESCREALNAQHVGNALYGMQGMSSDSVEVRAMLSALLPKVESCREALNAQHVGNALYGMQGMRGAAEFSILINFLYHQVTIIAGSPLLLKSLSSKDLVYLGQHLVLTLPVLREEAKDEHQRWETISILLADELLNRKSHADPFFRPGKSRSKAERRVYDISKSAFENAAMTVSSNEYLFNIFEADIVLIVPVANNINHSQSNNSNLIINIEVDGIHHQLERKKRFCMLRDKYLRSQGVVIERIEVSALRRMKDKEVKEWLLEMVGTYIDRKI